MIIRAECKQDQQTLFASIHPETYLAEQSAKDLSPPLLWALRCGIRQGAHFRDKSGCSDRQQIGCGFWRMGRQEGKGTAASLPPSQPIKRMLPKYPISGTPFGAATVAVGWRSQTRSGLVVIVLKYILSYVTNHGKLIQILFMAYNFYHIVELSIWSILYGFWIELIELI